jgi:hypothetical protein
MNHRRVFKTFPHLPGEPEENYKLSQSSKHPDLESNLGYSNRKQQCYRGGSCNKMCSFRTPVSRTVS